MTIKIKSIVNALVIGVIAFTLVNIIYFLIAYVGADTTGPWSFSYKHGSFSLNDEITGLKLWSLQANILIGGVSSGMLYYHYQKGNSIKT